MDKNIKALLEGTAVKDLVEAKEDTIYMVDPKDYQSVSGKLTDLDKSFNMLDTPAPDDHAFSKRFVTLRDKGSRLLKDLKKIMDELGDMED